MKSVPFTNHGENACYVGDIMVPAGETKLVPAAHLPNEQPKPAEPEAPPTPEAFDAMDLLGNPVADVLEVINNATFDGVPILTDQQLSDLEALEMAGENRDAVVEAISTERLRRAAESQEPKAPAEFDASALLSKNVGEIKAAIEQRDDQGAPVITDDQLSTLLAEEQGGANRVTLVEAIEKEREARQGAAE